MLDPLARRDHIINHFRDEDAVARAMSVAIVGDEGKWHAYRKPARDFLDAMEKSLPTNSQE